MTTTTLPHRVTPARVLRSEWHKFWTLRSTWITLAVTSALTAAMGAGLGAASPGAALLAMLLWTAVILTAEAVVLRRKDV